jgi:hypothetical protein
MSTITDYASLSQAVDDWLARSDLSGYLDYFIQMAEEKIYREIIAQNKGRGVRQMEAALSGTITNNAVAVPADYLGLKNAFISYSSNFYPLERTSIEMLYHLHPQQTSSGLPVLISRDSSNFVFGPYADNAYTLSGVYWQKATALSSSNTTTWMITAIPDALFAAVMASANEFIRDDEVAGMWSTLYASQLSSFIAQDQAENFSGSALAMRAA